MAVAHCRAKKAMRDEDKEEEESELALDEGSPCYTIRKRTHG